MGLQDYLRGEVEIQIQFILVLFCFSAVFTFYTVISKSGNSVLATNYRSKFIKQLELVASTGY